MATSSTEKLVKMIQEGQTQMLDYLRRADERGERQSRATLKALAAIQEGQKTLHEGQKVLHQGQQTLAQMLSDIQAITVRALELTRDIHSEVLDKKSSQH